MSRLDNFLSYILGNDKHLFSEVHIDQEVMDEITQIAIEKAPVEFVALLQGKVNDDVLHIDGLIFLPGETSDEGAVMKIFMLPPMSGAVGSVHSHPGFSAQPSNADLMFFAKNGLFHMIIAQPYTIESTESYDTFGERMSFKVV
jgi:proteasome lid subunit RPN8/RPN11